MTVFSDQQEISTILPTLFYKSTLIIERVKNQYIEIEIHQYKSSLLLHELFNRNGIQLIFGCLENYHKVLMWRNRHPITLDPTRANTQPLMLCLRCVHVMFTTSFSCSVNKAS